MNETGFDPKVANRSKLAEKRKAKVSEKEHREQAHEARLHTLDQICRLRDQYPAGVGLENDGFSIWSQLDDILNEHFARIVAGNYDFSKGLPETIYILTTELAEERLRADKAQHQAAVLREQLTDAETVFRIERDVWEEIKAIARGCNIDHTRDQTWVVKQIHDYIREIIPEDLRRHGENCDQEMARLQDRAERLHVANRDQQQRIRQLEALIHGKSQTIQSQAIEIAGLKDTKSAFSKEIQSLRAKNEELTDKVWTQENPGITEKTVQDLRKRAVKAEETVEELMAERGGHLDAMNSQDAKISQLQRECAARIARIGELDAGIQRQRKKILKLEAKIRESNSDTAAFSTAAVDLRKQLDLALEIITLHERARRALVDYHQSKDNLAKARERTQIFDKQMTSFYSDMGNFDQDRQKLERELNELRAGEAKTDGS